MTIDNAVLEIVRARAARPLSFDELSNDVTLGSDGLGLDSIAIAEVLLDCQQKFGVSVTGLLEGEPLTLRRLVAHLQQETPA
ncbi:MAG TPA: phosphopantetheine-binding protein [Thermoanaerobaculia bacterium]|nr:phosphopantetheine-binding protein [Thermoanaerobaculia bacterium]